MTNIVVRVWGCIPQPEQLIAGLFADAQETGLGFLVAAGVDALFVASYPLWYETRRAAWQGNYAIDLVTIEIEGVEVGVYIPSIDFVTPLVECRAEGGCVTGTSTCPQRVPFGAP